MQNSSHRIAFCPCCANDISEPRRLLAGFVDEIIYCDLRVPESWNVESKRVGVPTIRFVEGDVRSALDDLPQISLFFYRRDSTGEGGSGIYLLGRKWLCEILKRFSLAGGLIVSDGSNTGNHLFHKMTRPAGYFRAGWGWHFRPAREQPWLASHGLHIIEVTKDTQP